MRRLVLVGAVVALAVVGLATGATEFQVSLTATGIQPATSQVGWDDTVVFKNTDSVTHTLQIPRLDLTQDIKAGETFPLKLDVDAGSYQVRDRGARVFQGRIEVSVTGTVKLTGPATVTYGKVLNVKGTSPYGATAVVIETRSSGGSSAWTQVATTTPSVDGAFAAALTLSRGGRVVATAAGGQLRSEPLIVTVVPVMSVSVAPRRPAPNAFVKISSKLLPAGAATSAALERYDTLRKRWVRVKTAPYKSTGVAAVSLRATKGTVTYRFLVSRASTQPGYFAVTSKPFKITTSG